LRLRENHGIYTAPKEIDEFVLKPRRGRTIRYLSPIPEEFLFTMNLSRAAKKFRQSEDPKESKRKAAKSKAAAPDQAPEAAKAPEAVKPPEPVQVPEPEPEPVAELAEPVQPAEAAVPDEPKKKRPRFVFVRQKTDKVETQDQPKLPPLPQPSKKVSAKLMSKNLALPPKEEQIKVLRG
jgi:hypothetical protein